MAWIFNDSPFYPACIDPDTPAILPAVASRNSSSTGRYMAVRDDDSSPSPLDGEKPLTTEEKRRIRKILRDEDNMSWFRRKLKRFFSPYALALAAAAWSAGSWISDWFPKHFK